MPHILIIDDDDTIREILMIALVKAGYVVNQAENGQIGINRFCEDLPDLIITDIFMPEKDGIETIIDIRKDFPFIKIIAMSGGGQMQYGREYLNYAMKFGANSILQKPFKLKEMLNAVELALRQ